jgi:hypothetical protein
MAAALNKVVRGFLAKRGYLISQVGEGMPRKLDSYLTSLADRDIAFDQALIFDSDPETLNAFHDVCDAQKLVFQSDPNPARLHLDFDKGKSLLVSADIAAVDRESDTYLSPCLNSATVVIVRSKLSYFWSGKGDLYNIVDRMAAAGLQLHDVLQQSVGTNIGAQNTNVFLAFQRGDKNDPEGNHTRKFRISEALTNLSLPIARESEHGRLLGWGSYGFSAGVLNPGVLEYNGRLLLLARGERIQWPVQKRNNSHTGFLSASQPMLLTLGKNLQVMQAVEVQTARHNGFALSRFEDFRLMTFGGRVYSNHVMMHCEKEGFDQEPVRPQNLRTSMGISEFNIGKLLLNHLGEIELDRPSSRLEKNWAMFPTDNRVNIIYSFSPYRLFTTNEFPSLQFKFAFERNIGLPIPDDGVPVRNSINPIPYDSGHLLHIVHKVYPDKRYVFWAVLIDKATLAPKKMTRRPLLCSGSCAAASIIYICSAMRRDQDILVFAGIDDCSIGTWRIATADIDSQWAPII